MLQALIKHQGIPENLQQEHRALPPQAQAPVAQAPAATNQGGGDEPVNLFEAAAQAGQGGRGGGGAARGGAATAGAGAGAGAGVAAGGLGNLDFLRNNPQFQQLRQVVQQNPQMLEPILQQVGAGNPQLAELIGQYPDEFLALLGEDTDNDAPLPPGTQSIPVTEEERAAIERVSVCKYIFKGSTNCNSYVFSAFPEIKLSKLTSPATRTRSSLPIFCLSSLRKMNRWLIAFLFTLAIVSPTRCFQTEPGS